MSGTVTSEKSRFAAFVEEGAEIKRQRDEAIRKLCEAGHAAVACEFSPGSMWVEKNFFLEPERALRAFGVD